MTSDFTKMFLDKRNEEVDAMSQIDERERKRLEPYVREFKEVLQSIETRINALASESEEVRRHFNQDRDLTIVSGKSAQLDATTENPGDYVTVSYWIYTRLDGNHITTLDRLYGASVNNDRGYEKSSSNVSISGSLANLDLSNWPRKGKPVYRSLLTEAQIACIQYSQRLLDDEVLSDIILRQMEASEYWD